jgi:hypothetical protein
MNAPATPKYAAYLCSGCGLGDKLDVGALEKIAQKEGKMAVVKSHPFLCNAEGVQMIKDDIANDGVTHLCIAACSRRAKAEAFSFPEAAVCPRQPARRRDLGRRRGRRARRSAPGNGRGLRAHGLRRGQEDESPGRQRQGSLEQEDPRRRRRHVRHDGGAGRGRGRL